MLDNMTIEVVEQLCQALESVEDSRRFLHRGVGQSDSIVEKQLFSSVWIIERNQPQGRSRLEDFPALQAALCCNCTLWKGANTTLIHSVRIDRSHYFPQPQEDSHTHTHTHHHRSCYHIDWLFFTCPSRLWLACIRMHKLQGIGSQRSSSGSPKLKLPLSRGRPVETLSRNLVMKLLYSRMSAAAALVQ